MSRIYIPGETKGRSSVVDFNRIQVQNRYSEAEQDKIRVEYWLAKQIGEALCRKFPNREWHVDVDTRNQVIVIGCPSVSKRKGYRLHMKQDKLKDLIKRSEYAAAEILERYGVSRGRIIDPMTFDAFDRDVYDDCVSRDSGGASRI